MAVRLDPWRNIIGISASFTDEPDPGRPWLVLATSDCNNFQLGRPTYLRVHQVVGGDSFTTYFAVNKIDGVSITGIAERREIAKTSPLPSPPLYRAAFNLCDLGDAMGENIVWIACFYSIFYSSIPEQEAAVVTDTVNIRVYMSDLPTSIISLGTNADTIAAGGYENPDAADAISAVDAAVPFSHSSSDANSSTGAVRRFYVQIPINVTTGEVGLPEFVADISI